ncbi:MAG: hypothetical protein ACXVEF_00390 [Polyangiales bacterium]
MLRATAVFAAFSLTACAQLLSYDDYQGREPSVDATTPDTSAEASVDGAGDAETGTTPVRVPARPTASATASGKGKTMWLAVRKFKLASVDLTRAVKDEDAWKTFGFDLDGRCTSLDDSIANRDTCIRPSTASGASLVDGDGCRDNNFGHHIGALLRSAAPDTEPALDARVDAGQRTWVLRIDDVDVGDDGYAPASLWGVRDERPYGVKMLWDGSDVRMAAGESVIDGDLEKPLVVFPKGYVSGDSWVSGEGDDETFILPMTNDYLVPMHLQNAAFVIALEPDRSNGHQGTLVGALDQPAMEAMIKEIVRYAGSCPDSLLYKTALTSSLAACDLSTGAPSLQDPTKTCDALSFALGVDVRTVQPLTAVAPPRTPPVDPCAPKDAGTD